MVTGVLPMHVYRPIPHNGYFGGSFVRSLTPRRFVGTPSPTNPLPILELTRMPDVITFRQHAANLIADLLDNHYQDDSPTFAQLPSISGLGPTRLLPPRLPSGVRPVLYQVVNSYYGTGIIIEAKDFFVPGPDHRELHCIPLTQDSINYLSRTRGFDRTQVSVKDFVWVISLRPTLSTLDTEDREHSLWQARAPRPPALNLTQPFFFRVHEFIFATPAQRNILGIVLAVARRGNRGQAVNHIYAAFEGSPKALRVTQSVCSFPLTQVEREDLLLASARTKVSCAMRFSHTAISVQAQRVLTAEIRRFFPAHPNEAIMPLRVSLLPQEDRNWVNERLAAFTSYGRHIRVARLRMGKLFAVASASLASQAFLTDDKCTHEIVAFIPNLDGLPLRLQIELSSMAPDNGWNRSRNVNVWVVHSTTMTRATITFVQYDFDSRTLAVELSADTRSQQSIRDAVIEHGQVFDDHTARARVCVRLSRAPSGTDPVFELLAASNISLALIPHRRS
nr:unnamed protein product [Haemonchus contortus]